MEKTTTEPLLTDNDVTNTAIAFSSSFEADLDDIPPITSIKDFFIQFKVESRKLWYLSAPVIFTSVCQYSLSGISLTLAGHVGTLDLAAFSNADSVINGFSFGIMMGMGSALETLCGQAYGAGQLDMLGIYKQRSWIILLVTAIFLMFIYIFTTPLLKLIGQTDDISNMAGKFALWMIPQVFGYAINFPISKFLQSQSKMVVMAYISAVVLVLHTLISWLFMFKLEWGVGGGIVVLNFSWLFIVVAQLVYIFSGTCGRAWSGFSWAAFRNLWGFVKLSLASAVMLCLEVWYYVALVLFAGYLKNAEISMDALSICINIVAWVVMVTMGFHASISVRVSNELGAAHPRTAKFSVVVVLISSVLIGLLLAILLIIFRHQYPRLFADNEEVQSAVYKLSPFLATCIVINNIQPVLSGVAIGVGRQAVVAYVNIACYYILGIPLGLSLGFVANMGVEMSVYSSYHNFGIWTGMLTGTVVQTAILFRFVYITNWTKEASIAENRIKEYGGHQTASTTEIKS